MFSTTGRSAKQTQKQEDKAQDNPTESVKLENPQISPSEVKQKILDYLLERKRKGRTQGTLETNGRVLNNVSEHANLLNPTSVLDFLASAKHSRTGQPFKNSTKVAWVEVIKGFYEFYKIHWEPPHYQIEDSLPFIPNPGQVRAIIEAASKRPAHMTFFQFLEETAMRKGEALRLAWEDFHFDKRTVIVSHPEKGSLSRELRISEELCTMVKSCFTRDFEEPFPSAISTSLFLQRIRRILAKAHNDPSYRKIHLHTFRHYRASLTYHQTRDILVVKEMLGHKSLNSTMKYVRLLKWPESDTWIFREAKTKETEKELVEAGFDFIRVREDGMPLYRKRKSIFDTPSQIAVAS